MGKKRIITKAEGKTPADQGEGSSGAGIASGAVGAPEKKVSSKKQVLNGIAFITVSYNNTIISIADSKGNVIAQASSGSLGFKGTKKSTPYAANLVAKDCVEKAKKFNLTNVKLVVRGIGPARESAIRGVAGTGLTITSIMDATPVAHNGVKAPKPRRV